MTLCWQTFVKQKHQFSLIFLNLNILFFFDAISFGVHIKAEIKKQIERKKREGKNVPSSWRVAKDCQI